MPKPAGVHTTVSPRATPLARRARQARAREEAGTWDVELGAHQHIPLRCGHVREVGRRLSHRSPPLGNRAGMRSRHAAIVLAGPEPTALLAALARRLTAAGALVDRSGAGAGRY